MFYCDAEWRHAECLYAKCRLLAYLVSVGSTMVEPWPPHPKVNGLIPVPERGDIFFLLFSKTVEAAFISSAISRPFISR